MGINKKFQAVIDSFPVTKSIKKELILRINELVDDLKGGGGEDNNFAFKSIFVHDIVNNVFYKAEPYYNEDEDKYILYAADTTIKFYVDDISDDTASPADFEIYNKIFYDRNDDKVCAAKSTYYNGTQGIKPLEFGWIK